MQISVVYDNSAADDAFSCGWGFSCLIDRRILFDTGEEPDAILHNLNLFDADLSRIEQVVISHDHWDHQGGLWGLLEKRPGLTVYACPGFSASFKEKVEARGGRLVLAGSHQAISESISITGEIPGTYKGAYMPEQALIIETEEGVSVITGCSHPGIVHMLGEVKKSVGDRRLCLVAGGFHLNAMGTEEIREVVDAFKELGVEKVGPTHCTGDEAVALFAREFGDRCLQMGAGRVLEV